MASAARPIWESLAEWRTRDLDKQEAELKQRIANHSSVTDKYKEDIRKASEEISGLQARAESNRQEALAHQAKAAELQEQLEQKSSERDKKVNECLELAKSIDLNDPEGVLEKARANPTSPVRGAPKIFQAYQQLYQECCQLEKERSQELKKAEAANQSNNALENYTKNPQRRLVDSQKKMENAEKENDSRNSEQEKINAARESVKTDQQEVVDALEWAQHSSFGSLKPTMDNIPMTMLFYALHKEQCETRAMILALSERVGVTNLVPPVPHVDSAHKLQEAGITAASLRDSGMGAQEIHDRGYGIKDLHEAGFSITDVLGVLGIGAESISPDDDRPVLSQRAFLFHDMQNTLQSCKECCSDVMCFEDAPPAQRYRFKLSIKPAAAPNLDSVGVTFIPLSDGSDGTSSSSPSASAKDVQWPVQDDIRVRVFFADGDCTKSVEANLSDEGRRRLNEMAPPPERNEFGVEFPLMKKDDYESGKYFLRGTMIVQCELVSREETGNHNAS